MSASTLLSGKEAFCDANLLQSSRGDDEENLIRGHDLRMEEQRSVFHVLQRVCVTWYRRITNKIRLIHTLIAMAMLNITARMVYLTQRRVSSSSSATSFDETSLSSLTPAAFEEASSDTSLIPIEKIHSPSITNSTMAHMLVHQQQPHRSSNISIHRSTTPKETSITMTHSVDDRLFLTKQDSTRLLHLLTRFASEPQMSIYQNQSSPIQAQSQKNTDDFDSSSPPVSKPCLQFDIGDIQFDEIFHFNCDKNQPVFTATTDDPSYEQVDSTPPEASNDQPSNNQQIDEEILLDASPSMQETDSSGERHFRRRKRRSSLTRGSISLDETPTLTDATGKLDTDQPHESKHSVNETVELSLSIQANDTPTQPTPTSVTEEVNGTIQHEEEKPTSVSRYRGRRLRHRFYRQVSASPEITSTTPVNFYLPDEALNVESPRIRPRNPLSSISISPLLSPVSPPSPPIPAKDASTPTSPSPLIGALKRLNSLGSTKKMVRFADSVGLELTQVQYIRSIKAEESKELSFLLGASVLSSSPPSFSKNHLYLPNQSHLEHKPWSFDVAVPSKQISSEKGSARRFFCLYRQPNSEHPDIYLHEIWKSQIKLEHADIPRYQSSIGEQYLIGTIWVSNAGFAKHVSIKYTFNRWINTYEHEAQHRRHSGDFRNLDLFEFHIDVPADVDRVDFVLRYCVNGQEYWDNNDGKNYTLQTESAYTPQTTISLPHDCDFNEMRFY